MAASRRTGWEPFELRRHDAVRRPLPVTLLCDVSQSMQSLLDGVPPPDAGVRADRQRRDVRVLDLADPADPGARAPLGRRRRSRWPSAQVVDRYGGTHLAGCLRELLASRHGHGIRGGVLVIASDGWDSDPPEAAARPRWPGCARRARRVVWLNPRAAVAGFEPLVGSMAAALPYCDAFLPAHTLRGLDDVLAAISGGDSAPEGDVHGRPEPAEVHARRPAPSPGSRAGW